MKNETTTKEENVGADRTATYGPKTPAAEIAVQSAAKKSERKDSNHALAWVRAGT
jgi:hypothetical protein